MTTKFLDKVYGVRGVDAIRDLYDAWAESYDSEILENGYATPKRCAEALAEQIDDLDVPVLDFGCGTGLSGMALKSVGFTNIDGVDVSSDMLSGARDKGVYRSLRHIAPAIQPVPKPGAYRAIAAIGVIGVGAAPIDTFDLLMTSLAPGGLLVLSFNDHFLKDSTSEARISDWVDTGAARLLFKESGPHLPKINVNSTVYVIEKA